MLLALVIFLGAGFGGSFVGGVIYGQSQAENAETELSPRLGAGGQFPGGGQGANAGQRGQGRQNRGSATAQLQDGEAANSPQATPTTESGQGAVGARSASGRGGIVGTVRALEEDLLTITSARGEVAVTLSDSTAVFQVVEATRQDLAPEVRVRIAGSRNADGGVVAQSVVIIPEGVENLFGPAGGPSGRQRGGGS